MPTIDFIAIGQAHDTRYENYLHRKYFSLPNLEVTGFLDPFKDNKLNRILSRAWVLIHPAAREGLPTAFQEASAREVAILAYVDPGSYVSHYGRVVPKGGDIDALADELKEMIESGEWLEKGKAGREYNIKHHAINISIQRHLDVYNKLLNFSTKST
jgi:glycosyltransferase involved in cell wall biosynthesis